MTRIRNYSNLHNVHSLLHRLAKERCTAFNDMASAFLHSFFLGEFEHGKETFTTREDELDIVKSHEVPATERPDILKEAPIHDFFGVNRDSIFGWMSFYEAHPEDTQPALKRRFTAEKRSHPAAFHEWYAQIPASEYNVQGLHRLLRSLYICKHDFARWVTDTFSETPPMLATIGAAPEKSWAQLKKTKVLSADARSKAMLENVPESILDHINTPEISGAVPVVINLIAAAIEAEWDEKPRADFCRTALANYIHEVHRGDRAPNTIRGWITEAYKVAKR